MKKLEDYTWDQLNSFQYDIFPYRLVVVSPLSYDKVEKCFLDFINDDGMKNSEFNEYLQRKTNEPAITALFYNDSSIATRKKEIFDNIASMPQRIHSFVF